MSAVADKIHDLERYCRDLVAERERLTAEVARLREALAPFARLIGSAPTLNREDIIRARKAMPKAKEPT